MPKLLDADLYRNAPRAIARAPGFTPRAGGLAAKPRSGRRLESAIAAGLAVALGMAAAAQGTARVQHLRCTNSDSGASWTLSVDFDRQRVDMLPATITDQWISWHDPKQGFFDLERSTGKLELRNASSTGGYFLHYLCRIDK